MNKDQFNHAIPPRWVPIWVLAVVVLVAASCLDNSITGVRPLTLTLTAEPATTLVGDSITFRYTATGTDLLVIQMDYGDGETGSIPALSSGAVNMSGYVAHAYSAAGTYVATGTAVDQTGSVTQEVTVQITGG